MSVLPNRIIPESTPVIDANGQNNHDWWLFWYNLYQQVIGVGNAGAPAFVTQMTDDNEIDANTVDQYSLIRRVESLERQVAEPEIYPSQLDVTRALVLAQDGLLQDPIQRAQPVTVVTPGASPYSYQALFDGTLIVNGGTVSAIAVSRDGTTFYTTSVGSIPVSRLDTVKITYSGVPTVTFFPR